MKMHNLTGQRFGRLVAIRWTKIGKRIAWECQCDCGKSKTTLALSLTRGLTQSCGCLRNERTAVANKKRAKHGMWKSPEFQVWSSITDRCYNENHPNYANYGGRGITMCDRWRESFQNFYDDMGPRPEGKDVGGRSLWSIDRIDNNKGYAPDNCRWATTPTQMRNRRDNVLISFNGETKHLRQWSIELGIPWGTVYARYRAGMTPEQILSKTDRRQCSRRNNDG